ncbi:LysR substrate-binding domain-containing protein [Pseudomonas sp. LS-2]|jgi:LysR family transcriptional activator of mexEF-oprN operon|uniref:LysR substrate-binding domain-containing protein n=1 Tax=Pseudomonas sp. LS-2 TaxID=2315859 RepID=UPI000E73B9BB|nr:LysR substrate-binding domain-containing protein [Pseudomonas sp. LS-2]RJX74153.1 LysR family transcriptional regulator [Pseudomonas sp. LS-2]
MFARRDAETGHSLKQVREDMNPGYGWSKEFRIGLGGDVEYGLLPGLLARLRQESPGASLIVRRLEQDQLLRQLETGDISVALAYGPKMPGGLRRQVLRPLNLKLLRSDRSGHEVDLNEYCQRPHAQVCYSGDVTAYIDSELKTRGRSRHVEISLSQFSSLPLVMANTDLLATVPDYVADILVAYGGVRAQALPLQIPTVELAMSWDAKTDDAPQERWLRSRLACFLHEEDEVH